LKARETLPLRRDRAVPATEAGIPMTPRSCRQWAARTDRASVEAPIATPAQRIALDCGEHRRRHCELQSRSISDGFVKSVGILTLRYLVDRQAVVAHG
jgi:hypothetical protein